MVKVPYYSMVNSLGHDASVSCAAARAGIGRPSLATNKKIHATDTGEEESPLVHQVSVIAEGFQGEARLAQLLQGALRDISRQLITHDIAQKRLSVYLSIPGPYRHESAYELVADEAVRDELNKEKDSISAARQAEGRELTFDEFAARVLKKAAKVSLWPFAQEPAYAIDAGETGIAHALLKAMDDLKSGVVDVAILAAVDSLVDEQTLGWLFRQGRLKCSDIPCGLQPGEAAVAFVIVRADDSEFENEHGFAISNVEMAIESANMMNQGTSKGEALTALLSSNPSVVDRESPWLIADQNGEIYRANEWGYTQLRLLSIDDSYQNPSLWYPATSFGDTGAASAGVAMCSVAQAFDRGYAPAVIGTVISSSLSGERSAISLLSS